MNRCLVLSVSLMRNFRAAKVPDQLEAVLASRESAGFIERDCVLGRAVNDVLNASRGGKDVV